MAQLPPYQKEADVDAVSGSDPGGSALGRPRGQSGRDRPGSEGRPGPTSLDSPGPSVDFDHLSLAELRRYRQALHAEEDQVSYWRRIIQGRLDVMGAGRAAIGTDVAHLRPALAGASTGSRRRALVQVVPAEDLPPLPHLQRLWDRCPAPDDHAATVVLAGDLARAERQLSDYRRALHRRIEAATTELIARYCQDPSLCLSALPQPGRQPVIG